MVYAQSSICPRKWDAHGLLGFRDTNGSSNLSQTTGPSCNKKIVENLLNRWLGLSGWSLDKTVENRKESYIPGTVKTMEHESDGYTSRN